MSEVADLSKKISHYLKEWPHRARSGVRISPAYQGRFEPHFSYMVAPGMREWFFPTAGKRDAFVRANDETWSYPS